MNDYSMLKSWWDIWHGREKEKRAIKQNPRSCFGWQHTQHICRNGRQGGAGRYRARQGEQIWRKELKLFPSCLQLLANWERWSTDNGGKERGTLEGWVLKIYREVAEWIDWETQVGLQGIFEEIMTLKGDQSRVIEMYIVPYEDCPTVYINVMCFLVFSCVQQCTSMSFPWLILLHFI